MTAEEKLKHIEEQLGVEYASANDGLLVTDDEQERQQIKAYIKGINMAYTIVKDAGAERICSVCGARMTEGYVVHDTEYYCDGKCLRRKYSTKEYTELYKADEAYWTAWR